MTVQRCVQLAALLLAIPISPVVSQQVPAIPVRDLGPIVASAPDSLHGMVMLRGLPNGGVVVAEVVRRRVLFLDSTLSHLTVVIDSATYSMSSSLIPFGRDSTLFVDLASLGLLVIDNRGNVARTMSVPKAGDISYVSAGLTYGTPVIDPAGRLVYRAGYPRVPGVTPYGPAIAAAIAAVPDSAPLVRADFDTRGVDTIGFVMAPPVSHTVAATLDSVTRRMTYKDKYNPLAANDDWVGLSDGSIAIIRAHDYHIDFIDADGSRRQAAKLPYDWRRISDTEKERMVDSLRPILARVAAQTLAAGLAVQTAYGLRRLAREIEPIPAAELPDYEPPFMRGTSKADLDGNIWILPRMSIAVSTGLLYDVVNRSGQLVERVRLPAGRVLAGFGQKGMALLTTTTGTATHIEVARIR